MRMFDFFRFDKDFQFQNNKGDIVIIPCKFEYQTKDFENCMSRLRINNYNEIERMCFKCIENKEFSLYHPLRYRIEFSHYEKINFSGVLHIYYYSDIKDEKDYKFNLYIDNGKIYKIEEKK